MQVVTIVDIDSGNLLSIKRSIENFGAKVKFTKNYKDFLKADKIILPGVGAFGKAIKKLEDIGFRELVHEPKFKNIPTLGICLGMQLLFEKSFEFGSHKGLGLIEGEIKLLPEFNKKYFKIPSIGWQQLIIKENKIDPFNILKNLTEKDKFYFVHSFCAYPNNSSDISANYYFDKNLIPAVTTKKNIIGFQFHPEKSGKSGLNLINNFLNI
jgi:imidazole glycerol-phosphate synthase subunit HisH